MKHFTHISMPRKAAGHGNDNGNDGIFAKIEDLLSGLLFWKD